MPRISGSTLILLASPKPYSRTSPSTAQGGWPSFGRRTVGLSKRKAFISPGRPISARYGSRQTYALTTSALGILASSPRSPCWQVGRLSVDIQEADIRDVLTQIGEQAGIAVQYNARAEKRISARLMDVELEKGLQRLLRLASLGYAILYVQRPGGDVAIREVRRPDQERQALVQHFLEALRVDNQEADFTPSRLLQAHPRFKARIWRSPLVPSGKHALRSLVD